MSKYRRDAKVDDNQNEAVKILRKLGVSVELGHDDFILGYNGVTLWVEWKSDRAISKRTGKVLESGIKDSQKRIREQFKGAYLITGSVFDIINFFGIKIS
jgi:hypothetical protein